MFSILHHRLTVLSEKLRTSQDKLSSIRVEDGPKTDVTIPAGSEAMLEQVKKSEAALGRPLTDEEREYIVKAQEETDYDKRLKVSKEEYAKMNDIVIGAERELVWAFKESLPEILLALSDVTQVEKFDTFIRYVNKIDLQRAFWESGYELMYKKTNGATDIIKATSFRSLIEQAIDKL